MASASSFLSLAYLPQATSCADFHPPVASAVAVPSRPDRQISFFSCKRWHQKCAFFCTPPRRGCWFLPVSARTQSVLRYNGSFSWRCGSRRDGRKTEYFSLDWHSFREEITGTIPCAPAFISLISFSVINLLNNINNLSHISKENRI